MRIRYIVALVVVGLLLAAPFVKFVDSIEGIVLDSETNEPIANAVLIVGWPELSLEGAERFREASEKLLLTRKGGFSLKGIFFQCWIR